MPTQPAENFGRIAGSDASIALSSSIDPNEAAFRTIAQDRADNVLMRTGVR
jgi:hypothetical protein